MKWQGVWNKEKQIACWTVNTCDIEGKAGSTHIRVNTQSVPIPTYEELLAKHYYSGAGVRCLPILQNGKLMYVISFRRGWKV